MKRLLLVALYSCIMCVLCVGELAYGAEVKIGVIDLQKIMIQSQAAKDAREVFSKDVEGKRKVLLEKQKEAQILEEEINKKGKEMAPSVLREKAENLAKEVKELKRLKNELEEELKGVEMELSRKLTREIAEVVKGYSEKENYTIIMEKSSLLASDEAIDITDKIIEVYDTVK